MTWQDASDSTALTWADQTLSDTTARNTSRFVLMNRSSGSVHGGVDFAVHLRSTAASGRGAAFLISSANPVRLHSSGDSLP